MTTRKVYYVPETAIVFTESGGSAVFTPKNAANGAGRVSAQYDRGAGAIAAWFKWEATAKVGSNATRPNPVRLYLYAPEAASASIDIGATDAAVSDELQFANYLLFGQILVSGTAANVGPWYSTGLIWVPGRYVSVGMWNATGQTLTNVNGDNKITLTPVPDQVQSEV